MPNNHDPDDLISKFGNQSILELINQPKSLLQILWDNLTKNIDISTPEKRVQLENKINFILNQIKEKSLRFHYSQAFNKLKLELFGLIEKKINIMQSLNNGTDAKGYTSKLKTNKKNSSPNEKTKILNC